MIEVLGTFIILGIGAFVIFTGARKGPKQEFKSPSVTTPFPDRRNDIIWHTKSIDKALTNEDLNLANLSYAQLIESIRQQNINENGRLEELLLTTRKEYEEFRNNFGLEYPKQFLPPDERKRNKPQIGEKFLDSLVFLETLNFEELPKLALKNVDIVRTVAQWNEIGLKPKKDRYGKWNDIKRQERYFSFVEVFASNSKHKLSLETGKRITSKPYFIKALIEQGIPLEEFIENGADLPHFINADNLYWEKNYEEALKEIELAILNRTNEDYAELRKSIQVKLGNQDVVEEQFKKYEFDIDTPIHTGEIFDWFKVLFKNKRFDKFNEYVQLTNQTLDRLSIGKVKPRIYGEQSRDWYLHKKQDFNMNLFRIFDFKNIKIEKSIDMVATIDLFIKSYSGKEMKPIESVADIYVQWDLKDKAIELYNLCLNRVQNEEKPRVKERLTKKIEELG